MFYLKEFTAYTAIQLTLNTEKRSIGNGCLMQVVRMLVVVLAVFVIAWLPHTLMEIIRYHHKFVPTSKFQKIFHFRNCISSPRLSKGMQQPSAFLSQMGSTSQYFLVRAPGHFYRYQYIPLRQSFGCAILPAWTLFSDARTFTQVASP